MKSKELIDLYHEIEDAYQERLGLGDFDANSAHMKLLLEGLLKITQHAIESAPDYVPPKRKRR